MMILALKIILSVVFLCGIVMFYFAGKFSRGNDKVEFIIKIIGAAIAIVCAILTVFL